MLIVVLWASFGLVAVALLFGHSMLMSYRSADNDVAGRQAEQAIEGGARYVESLMVEAETPGEFLDPTTYVAERVPVGEAEIWLLGRPDDSVDGLTRTYGMTDEAAKLNLNTATIAMLRLLPGMTEELAASIIDWRDTNEDVTDNGAEASVYLAKNPAYACKNAPFESVEELALVNGATREILYGEDMNLNGVLDANEDDGDASEPPDNSDGRLDAGIVEHVTAFSREPNKRSDGTERINVNQPAEALGTLLRDTFGEARAQQILAALGQGTTYTSVLQFYIRSTMTEDEFGKVSDALSIKAEASEGLVNVNTASETVLACIPGIGTEKASTLISTRASRSDVGSSMTWIVEILGEEAALLAGPFVTGQSWQVTADIAAVGRHGRGYRRTKFVIDQSADAPRIIYRRNLSPLGWALGRDIRQDLALRKEVR